jgi:cell division protein FtsB
LSKGGRGVQGLNRRERKAFVRILLLALLVAGIFLVFVPGCSLYTYCTIQEQRSDLLAERDRLFKETQALKEEIHLLQHDEGYLEKIAREEYGMLKKNEELYYLSPPRREGN